MWSGGRIGYPLDVADPVAVANRVLEMEDRCWWERSFVEEAGEIIMRRVMWGALGGVAFGVVGLVAFVYVLARHGWR